MFSEDDLNQARREGVLRAAEIIDGYSKAHWRRLRVHEICFQLKKLLEMESAHPRKPKSNAPALRLHNGEE
jgi:hypothetical protein